jgi:sugar lactone lactonase YvrE
VGRTASFTATARYQGTVVSGVSFTWTTGASSVATIDASGLASGVGVGQTEIRASARGVTSAPATLTVEEGPAFALTSIEPPSGPGGTPVTLVGTAFGPAQGTTRVLFGSAASPEILSWSNTRIVARVPYGLIPGQVGASLSTDSGASNSLPFTVTTTPYVAAIAPASAVQGSKVTVTLSGSNLGTCSVGMNRNGAAATDVVVDNASKVVERFGAPDLPDLLRVNVEVAASALPGDLAVSCGSSLPTVTADNRFTVIPRPSVIVGAVGTGSAGLSGDNGPVLQAELNGPTALVLGSSGELYIADTDNHRVRVANLTASPLTVAGVQVAPGTLTTLAGGLGQAGNADPGSTGNGGLALQSQLNTPTGLAFDKRGLLFVADSGNHCVRVINLGASAVTLPGGALAPGVIDRVAGACGLAGYAGDGGQALPNSRFNRPSAVAVDANGMLYVADTDNHRIRVVNTSTGSVTSGLGTFPSGEVALVAGSSAGSSGDQALAGPSTQLNAPAGLVVDPRGLLFVADTGNNRVRAINTATAAVTFDGPASSAGGLGITVQPGYIDGAVGAGGAAGFSGDDWYCSRLFDGGRSYYSVPCAPQARMAGPTGLALGALGELVIADRNNHRVRLAGVGAAPVYRAGKWFFSGAVDTLAGSGTTGSGMGLGDNGPALNAELFEPRGVAYDADAAVVYVADTLHHRIRRVVMDLVRDPYSGELGPWPTDLTSGTATLDVSSGVLHYTLSNGVVVDRFLGDTGGIFSFSGKLRLFAGVTLQVVGARPAVLAATGDMEINGKIFARNGGMTRGPGISTYAGPGHGIRADRSFACNASYITDYGGNAYGSPELRPVTPGTGGKVIGGALVLSAGKPGTAANLTVGGEVNANSDNTQDCTIGGSGGGLRLVATSQVSVTGTVVAQGGGRAFSLPDGFCCNYTPTYAFGGSEGRIRLEAPAVVSTGSITPAPSTATTLPAAPPWM